MTPSTQLLCTFVNLENVERTILQIVDNYSVAFNTIYILENIDAPSSICCTYNINVGEDVGEDIPQTTISLHRKKATNTLYTINALNALVAELNDGVQSNKFQIPWEEYRNTILVTAYGHLKRINTKLVKIVTISDLDE